MLGPEIEDQHSVVGDGIEERPYPRRGPVLLEPRERPALHHPNCLWVALAHSGIDSGREEGEVFFAFDRRRGFNEGIGGVEVVGTEKRGLLLDEILAQLGKQLALGIQ